MGINGDMYTVLALLDLYLTGFDPTRGRAKPKQKPINPKYPSKTRIPNGCKAYTIDGITVIAISEKSAIKKVNLIKSKSQADK